MLDEREPVGKEERTEVDMGTVVHGIVSYPHHLKIA